MYPRAGAGRERPEERRLLAAAGDRPGRRRHHRDERRDRIGYLCPARRRDRQCRLLQPMGIHPLRRSHHLRRSCARACGKLFRHHRRTDRLYDARLRSLRRVSDGPAHLCEPRCRHRCKRHAHRQLRSTAMVRSTIGPHSSRRASASGCASSMLQRRQTSTCVSPTCR